MRRYALVLLLVAACTQDPYERAAACEDIVVEADVCEYKKIAQIALLEKKFDRLDAAGKDTSEGWGAEYQRALQRECHSQETRACELFLEDFRAGRVK